MKRRSRGSCFQNSSSCPYGTPENDEKTAVRARQYRSAVPQPGWRSHSQRFEKNPLFNVYPIELEHRAKGAALLTGRRLATGQRRDPSVPLCFALVFRFPLLWKFHAIALWSLPIFCPPGRYTPPNWPETVPFTFPRCPMLPALGPDCCYSVLLVIYFLYWRENRTAQETDRELHVKFRLLQNTERFG